MTRDMITRGYEKRKLCTSKIMHYNKYIKAINRPLATFDVSNNDCSDIGDELLIKGIKYYSIFSIIGIKEKDDNIKTISAVGIR